MDAASQRAFVDELEKISSSIKMPKIKGVSNAKLKKFFAGVREEVGPAIGATIGAGFAKMYGVSPVAGAAAGYGVGAIPEIIHGIRHRRR